MKRTKQKHPRFNTRYGTTLLRPAVEQSTGIYEQYAWYDDDGWFWCIGLFDGIAVTYCPARGS